MPTLYLTEQHSLVRREAEYLVVQIPEDKDRGASKRRVEVPLIKVDQVVVVGDVTLTTPALHALLERQVEVCFLSWQGAFKGRLTPELQKNSLIRIEQHRAHNDSERKLALAKQFVRGKLTNMRTSLMRYNRKLGDREVESAVAMLKGAIERVDTATGIDTLLGVEGSGTASYFGVLGKLLKQDMGFSRRTKRPPTDPINAILSFGYTLLASCVSSAVQSVGLDPFVGYLHSSQFGKPALALDIMEEFRPLIVDSTVLTVVNNRILQQRDFVEDLGSCRLTDSARRQFLHRFEERMSTTILHPVFNYQATYRRCLELQVRVLAKYLMGDVPQYSPFIVR